MRRCRPRRGRRDTSARSPGTHDVQAPDGPGQVFSAFRVLAHAPLPVSDSLVRTLSLEPSRCQSSYGALGRGWSRRADLAAQTGRLVGVPVHAVVERMQPGARPRPSWPTASTSTATPTTRSRSPARCPILRSCWSTTSAGPAGHSPGSRRSSATPATAPSTHWPLLSGWPAPADARPVEGL